MSFAERALDEVKSIATAAAFFGCWIGGLVLLKQLVLAEYQIEFNGLSKVVIGALILSKVVLVLEHVPLSRLRSQPAWLEVLVRSALYTLGTFVVLLLERSVEARVEYGGFVAAVSGVIAHADVHHLWVNTLCMAAAFVSYNVLSVVRSHFGEGTLLRLFLLPIPTQTHTKK